MAAGGGFLVPAVGSGGPWTRFVQCSGVFPSLIVAAVQAPLVWGRRRGSDYDGQWWFPCPDDSIWWSLSRIRVVLRRLPFFGRDSSSGAAGLVAAAAQGGFLSRWLDSFHRGQIQQPWGQIRVVPVCCAEVLPQRPDLATLGPDPCGASVLRRGG